MKFHTILWLIIILLFLPLLSCVDSNDSNANLQLSNENPLIGAWKFIYSESIYADTTIVSDSTDINSIYLINKDHFSFTSSSIDSNELLYAGYGRYNLDNNGEYIEYVEFHSTPKTIGLSVKFNSKIEGDIWVHEGSIPIDESNTWQLSINQGNDQYILKEYRRRLK